MGLNRRFAEARARLAKEAQGGYGYLEDIMPFIKKGTVVPIISNSFRMEQIFRDPAVEADADHGYLSIYEQLTQVWADEIGYPAEDGYNLARVAKFFITEQMEDVEVSRAKYLRFLSDFLLHITADDISYQDVVESYQKREVPFSELVRVFDYPRFPPGIEDPLRLLARLPLKIYITTSYYDFMERALEAEDKKPRTHVIFWEGGKLNSKPEHLPDPHYEPTYKEPAVYHLFGLEDYPQTLALTEDDYLDFLISVVKDTNTMDPVVPLRLREALAESRLLVLGYNAGDLDFRILFQFIRKFRSAELSPRGMLIQPKPGAKQSENREKSMDYLSHYFVKNQFEVEWTDPEKFIHYLWGEWDKYRKGQS